MDNIQTEAWRIGAGDRIVFCGLPVDLTGKQIFGDSVKLFGVSAGGQRVEFVMPANMLVEASRIVTEAVK